MLDKIYSSSVMLIMNSLDNKTRELILHLLVEGNSLSFTARIADVSRNTVDKLLRDVGATCLGRTQESPAPGRLQLPISCSVTDEPIGSSP